MTMVVPCRLMTRHRSHMGFTDALTFMGTSFVQNRAGRGAVKGFERTQKRPAAPGHRSKGTLLAVRIRGPASVTATVCSKWAASDPSRVEIVHPSS